MKPRRLAILFALAVSAGSAAPIAARDRTAVSEFTRTLRQIYAGRIEEATPAVTALATKTPDATEVKWLQAQLSFHRGDYTGAISRLAGLEATALDGEVGALRTLATNSQAVTAAFKQTLCPSAQFVIRYAAGLDAALAPLACDVLETMHTQLAADFGATSREIVRVELLGAPADLAKLSPLTEAEIETTGTIALSKYGKLMVVSPRATMFGYNWMDTLAHEYTHLVVSRLSNDTVPVWMQEGLARFEQTRWRQGPGVALSPTEQAMLANGLRRGRLVTLDEMHPSMAKLPSQEAAALAYAEVYTLIGWMHQRVGYPGIVRMLVAQRDGASTKHAVAEVLGLSWSAVEATWKNQLRTTDTSRAQRNAQRHIRFGKTSRDTENIGLDAASTGARKFARLAGMLRARGKLAAAAVEYERAYALEPQNAFIAGKLARTLVELGEISRAITVAEPLLARDAEDATAAVTVGVARSQQHEWAAAAKAFELALRISPFDPAVRCGLAEAYQALTDNRAERERQACEIVRAP